MIHRIPPYREIIWHSLKAFVRRGVLAVAIHFPIFQIERVLDSHPVLQEHLPQIDHTERLEYKIDQKAQSVFSIARGPRLGCDRRLRTIKCSSQLVLEEIAWEVLMSRYGPRSESSFLAMILFSSRLNK